MSNESGDNQNGFRIAPKPVVPNEYEEESSKYLPATDPSLSPEFESLGDLPKAEPEIFLIARDPHWLFTYWDFDYSQFPTERQLKLRVFRGDELESTIDLNEIARNWYIPVRAANASYRIVFGLTDSSGQWHELGSAGPAQTPPESVSPDWDAKFATVPFHLSFNLLLEVIAAARRSGEPLAEALGRLQQRGAGGALGEPSSWAFDQIRVLEALLGKQTVDQLFSLSSAELSSFLQQEIRSRLDSESASEILAKSRLAELLLPAESSLFGGSIREALAREVSSAGVSSFQAAGVGGESSLGAVGGESSLGVSGGSESMLAAKAGSETGASWERGAVGGSWEQGAVGGSWESAVSSFGMSSRELSERFLPVTGAAETSSYGLASEQSLGLSSSETFPLGLSSAEIMGLGLGSVELSSAVAAGWSGLQFELSSWNQLFSETSLSSEVGASWSGQAPYGERNFFLHVNAEVIFYGGTDPRAKVTVDGEPIELQPDGSFRYHFKLPDGNFEIPIRATSPDGIETRAATLRFSRATAREGDVGATGQPGHLSDPIGRR